ncbi:Dimethyl sulfoxide/trimethylamine N-oxide reductase [Austwickia sp. TVS 96-490-7B]|uniref:molybdopterin-dependent oxidoreductase n=1 Tax=Austwickia sp. TVS 96-490-7B TaxID=2830843 RepID=UPI001D5C4702|nr:molybdopterin-dependent oxidoreductase [Austwickia sp. TVS 96-490-7B]MBW3085459.1 Dimethyl sulfoxide/trimethylamine N-oxide reductase [Austwickia sp. TVS 96-490-7B]
MTGRPDPTVATPDVPEYHQASHWGTYTVASDGQDITAVTPWAGDQDPSPLLRNLPGSVTHRSRIDGPAVRRGWWEDGPGPSADRGTGRGKGSYLRVSWDDLLDRLADEFRRVIDTHGNHAIYGSSYGWGSAGRFHHAQSQIHRFLHTLGGATRSVNTYSTGALEVFLPQIVCPETDVSRGSTPWSQIVEHTDVWLALGGTPAKNTGTNDGGTGDHPTRGALTAYLNRGGTLIGVSPLRADLPDHPDGGVTWIAPRPGSDTAFLLALCHTLLVNGHADHEFLSSYTVGHNHLNDYLRGHTDGIVKDAAWAAQLCHIPTEQITRTAHQLTTGRALITATWSLQRQQHGEMAIWAVVALAAYLGQIGLPGGGFGFGYGSMNEPGLTQTPFGLPSLPQGPNPVTTRVPVAALSDMLLRPGATIPYATGTITYPDIRLVHWAGGNPFHHHQNLNRLRRALARPDTVIVHDPYWTAMARHADIVIPSTTAAERDDFTGSRNGALLVAMHAATARHADSRDDYDTFTALADRLGIGAAFTEGRTSQEWIRYLYEEWRHRVTTDSAARDLRWPDGPPPSYDEFRARGVLRLPTVPARTMLTDWRADPTGHPLSTPSGKIQLTLPRDGVLTLPDRPHQPTWSAPAEWDEETSHPLHLIANQPRTRLHSQLDHGPLSQASKIAGREPIHIHPVDAAARGISDGDLVRVFNHRGHCLAGAVLDDTLRPAVVNLSTGAWYDPAAPTPVPVGDDSSTYDPLAPANLDVHGNPNVLTSDRRTSSIAQATTGQWVMVQVERYDPARWGPARPVRAHDPAC